MNDLSVDLNTGEITNYKPRESLQKMAFAEVAERHYRRAHDIEGLRDALTAIWTERQGFIRWWEANKKPGKGNQYVLSDTDVREQLSEFGLNEKQVSRWRRALKEDVEVIVEKQIPRILKYIDMEVSAATSSASEDWYTPNEYMETVREFFGGIDLDPCSCEKANLTVQAKQIFTKDDDSLTRQWHGRVFMNPPYGKDGADSTAGIFCTKAISEYESGNSDEIIILVNSSHAQKWQRELFNYAVCFVDHRIRFIAGDGSENSNPTFMNMFVYLGDRKEEFSNAFSVHGYVMEKIS